MEEEIVWKIGGEAGYGILSTGYMFSQIMKKLGYYVFSTTEYPSLIRGGHNTYTVRASKEQITSHTDKVDILLALDELTAKKHIDEIRDGGVIICDNSIEIKTRDDISIIRFPFEERSQKYGMLKNAMKATMGIGICTKIMGINKKIVEKMLINRFKAKGKEVIKENIEAFKQGYDEVDESIFSKKVRRTKEKDMILINGNTAIAIGAIRAGCNFMSSYPMTPATSIMQYLAKKQEEYNIVVHQSEDEIAALNNALGASFAGARTLVATSGGGFALMNETLSLSGSAEVPVVIVIAQRPGPATGLPTRTEQGDLRFAIHAGHGEFPKVVVAPGDVNECFDLTLQSFNIAERYQVPVIIVTDKYLAVSLSTVPEFKDKGYKIDRGLIVRKVAKKLAPLEKYKRYKITKDGISPRTIPGVENGIQCTIGDEHDEEGYIVEEPEPRKEMMDKRMRKMELIKKEFKNRSVNVYGNRESKIVIVGWGSTKGQILEATKELKCKFVQVKVMHPFPAKELEKKVGEYDHLILVENNQTGQLGSLIEEHTNLIITERLLKYDGRPFNPKDIIKFVRGL